MSVSRPTGLRAAFDVDVIIWDCFPEMRCVRVRTAPCWLLSQFSVRAALPSDPHEHPPWKLPRSTLHVEESLAKPTLKQLSQAGWEGPAASVSVQVCSVRRLLSWVLPWGSIPCKYPEPQACLHFTSLTCVPDLKWPCIGSPLGNIHRHVSRDHAICLSDHHIWPSHCHRRLVILMTLFWNGSNNEYCTGNGLKSHGTYNGSPRRKYKNCIWKKLWRSEVRSWCVHHWWRHSCYLPQLPTNLRSEERACGSASPHPRIQ